MSAVSASRNLSHVLDDPENSFSVVRLFCALAVVVSHSFLLVTGSGAADPLAWASVDLGQVAVNTFFFLSGLMLARSYSLRPNLLTFFRARALRILPALIASGLVVALLIAPFGTHHTFSGYYEELRTWLYPAASATLFEEATLTDVFAFGTQPGEINRPLWTIKYELLAYAAFGIAAALGFMRHKAVVLTALAVFAGLFVAIDFVVVGESPLGSVLRFGSCFLLGVAAHQFATHIRLKAWIAVALIGGWLVLDDSVVGPALSIVAIAYAALVIGALRFPVLTREARNADLSYGLYLYAWPVQQALLPFVLGTSLGVVGHLALTIIVGGTLAALSWHFVERPALALKVWRAPIHVTQ